MTQDEIYEMAHQAGVKNEFNYDFRLSIEAFAKLVAAKEREACAKLCEDAISNIWEYDPEYAKQIGRNVCTNLATAIRARGEA